LADISGEIFYHYSISCAGRSLRRRRSATRAARAPSAGCRPRRI